MKEEKKKQIRDIMGDLKYLDKESLTLMRDNANLLRRRDELGRQEICLIAMDFHVVEFTMKT